jgi:hypothetical protein
MSFRDQLKQAWDALAYADAGEFLPYAEKCRVLGVEPPADCRGYLPPREPAPRRVVALNLGRSLDLGTVDYAIGAAQGLEAGLMLLRQPEGAPASVIAEVRARIDASGIPWGEERLAGPWVDAVSAFLRVHPSVVCLVLAPEDLTRRGRADLRRGRQGRAFPTPVVVVQGGAPLPQPA